MKKFSMAAAVTSVALLVPGLAAAESFNYASVKGGWTQVRDSHFDVESGDRIGNNYDSGYNFALAVGRQYPQSGNFRVRSELELGYQQADVDRHVVREFTTSGNITSSETSRAPDPEGEFSMFYGFISAYGERDLNLIDNASFIFGAGGGLAQVTFDEYGAGGAVLMDDDAVSYGFHLTTGVSYHLNEQVSLEATYRYISIEDVSLEAEDGTSTRQRIESHNLMAGVRVAF